MSDFYMLKVEEVFKAYKKNEVLKGVTFEVKDGEIKGLVGINGAGKSTLVEIICGVKTLDSGKILLFNEDATCKKNSKKLKYLFGYMPQSFCFYQDLSVIENLEYACAIYGLEKNRAVEVANLCFLGDKLRVLAKNLSGGYKQFLSMALSLIHNPKFLILDEPTTAMDPLFRRKFWDIIKVFKKNGGTVLVITHYMEELLECDSFVCLSGGKIKIDEKTKKYIKQNGFLDIEKILKKCESDER